MRQAEGVKDKKKGNGKVERKCKQQENRKGKKDEEKVERQKRC